jgi:nucleoside-diphosphate-sugar epimerase
MPANNLILVTGATGYVGKWCVVKLLEKGYRVRGTVRSAAKAAQVRATIAATLQADAASRLELVEADILADAGWAEAMKCVAAVLHTATVVRADEPRDSSIVIRPAIEGTERILRFAHAAGIKRVVLTSSIATVGYGHGHTRGRRTYDESYFTNLDNMRWTWAYCLGMGLRQSQRHGADDDPSRCDHRTRARCRRVNLGRNGVRAASERDAGASLQRLFHHRCARRRGYACRCA